MTIEFFISTLMYDESKTDYIIKKADDHSKKWIHILPVAKVYQHEYFCALTGAATCLHCKSPAIYFSLWVLADINPL